MSAYLQNLLTHTTTKYASLRRTLTGSEEDGDTEDDSHLTRVLRAYYNEKGRPFPPWLPPDPKELARQQHQYDQQSGGGVGGYLRGVGGNMSNPQLAGVRAQDGGGGASGRSSLSDLWGDSGSQQGGAGQQQGGSLRSNALRRGGSGQGGGQQQQQQQPSYMSAQASSQNSGGGYQQQQPQQGGNSTRLGPRPLPSQRAGSYQSQQQQQQVQQQPSGGLQRGGGYGGGGSLQPQPSVSGGSAQDRLKARLWGGRQSAPGGPQGRTPSPQPPQGGGGYGRNPYDNGGAQQRYGR